MCQDSHVSKSHCCTSSGLISHNRFRPIAEQCAGRGAAGTSGGSASPTGIVQPPAPRRARPCICRPSWRRALSRRRSFLEWWLIDLRQKFVALDFGLLLREPVVALARADDVELPHGVHRAVRPLYIVPIAENQYEPPRSCARGYPGAESALLVASLSQRLKVTFGSEHHSSPTL